MKEQEILNKFGEFLVENLRDSGIQFSEKLLNNEWKAPALKAIQEGLQSFSKNQKDIIRSIIIKSMDHAIHHFLFAIEEQADFDNTIQIKVDNKNIVELSDGLSGESLGDDGWNAKYSKYKD